MKLGAQPTQRSGANFTWRSWHIALAVALAFAPCSLEASDWPMGRADAQGTGATSENLPDDLELLWEVEVKGLGFDAGPIVAAGTVYANDHDGRVLALDLATGKERWRLEFEAGFVAPPAYHNGVVYVGDYDGTLRALDAADGTEKWHYETGLQIDASPNFYEDTVLFTSQDGSLYCLKQETGAFQWKYSTADQLQCGPTLAGNRTFLGGCDSQLHIIDVRTGELIGKPLPLDAPTGSTPSVFGETVLVPTYRGEIFSFAMPETDPEWRFLDSKLADEFKNSVAIANGLAVATSRNKRVFALDIATGDVKWVKVLRKRSDASPVIAGDSVIVAAADGRIIRFDLKTGDEQWLYEVKGAFLGSPAVADGKLVLTNDRGTIFCFGKK